MSDVSGMGAILAALPLGVEVGDPSCSLALLPCLSGPLATRHFPLREEL